MGFSSFSSEFAEAADLRLIIGRGNICTLGLGGAAEPKLGRDDWII